MVKKCIVAGSVIMKGGRVLMLKHKRLGKWLYPGGHVEENEIPTETAVREALEETGFRIRLVGKNKLGRLNAWECSEPAEPMMILYENVRFKEGMHRHFDLIYLSKPVGRRRRIAKGESKEIKWISESDIDRMDTYGNVRSVLHYAFKRSRANK